MVSLVLADVEMSLPVTYGRHEGSTNLSDSDSDEEVSLHYFKASFMTFRLVIGKAQQQVCK